MVFSTRAIQQRVFEVSFDRPRDSGGGTESKAEPPSISDPAHRPSRGYWVPDPAKAITEELNADDLQLVDTCTISSSPTAGDGWTRPRSRYLDLPLAVDAPASRRPVDTVEEANPEVPRQRRQ